ncbi:hypothetical protein K8R33_00765 [archaeon]|nr:hypothetical protein [archaeon]
MKLRDRLFLPVFITALLISIILLGNSLTGYFAFIGKSMHCDAGECYVLCQSNQECEEINQVCCQKNNFGICKEESECKKTYEFIPEVDITENIRQTSQKANIMTFSITTAIISIVGILYYFSRRTHKKLRTILEK